MKRLIYGLLAVLIIAAGVAIGSCVIPFFSVPWQGTWWGVQDAGTNWSGDRIRNLETFTFTKDGEQILVEHKTQRGAREINGSLSGTAVADGGRLTITCKETGRVVTFTFSRTSREIETTLKNEDGTPVVLKELTAENNGEMEQIRSEIVSISAKPENKVNTTLSRGR